MMRPALRLLTVLPAAVLLVASVCADLVAITGTDPAGIWTVLPAGPISGDWWAVEAAGTTLFLLAIGLARAKSFAFWSAVVLFAAAVVVQGLVLGHAVAAGLAMVALAALVATAGRYRTVTPRRELVAALALEAAGLGLVVLATALAVTGTGSISPTATVAGVAGWLDVATPEALPLAALASFGGLLFVARVMQLVGAAMVLSPGAEPSTPTELAKARSIVSAESRSALLPYQLGPQTVAYADEPTRTAVSYARTGRAAVALGDPIGDAPNAWRTFAAWADRARRLDWIPGLYQATESGRTELERLGWRAYLIGREAVIDPTRFRLGRPRLANVRHTITRSRRGGVTVSCSLDGLSGLPDAASLVPPLVALDADWRRTAGPALGFTVGRFDASDLEGAAVAVALDPSGTPVGMVVLRRTGADGSWMLDLMRRRRDSVPGIVEACLVAAIEALGERGVHRLSLGMAPLWGLDPREGPIPERVLAIAARALRPFYDYPGLAFYKDKFDPIWEPRYIAVRDRRDLVIIGLGLLKLHLGGSWMSVVRSLVASVRPPVAAAVPPMDSRATPA